MRTPMVIHRRVALLVVGMIFTATVGVALAAWVCLNLGALGSEGMLVR